MAWSISSVIIPKNSRKQKKENCYKKREFKYLNYNITHLQLLFLSLDIFDQKKAGFQKYEQTVQTIKNPNLVFKPNGLTP